MFSTKAKTLETLRTKVKSAAILDLVFFSVEEWKNNSSLCLQKIKDTFQNIDSFIVRSSSLSEDLKHSSNAGAYESILNVTFDNLPDAIQKVIDSYKLQANAEDQVLIQPMLHNVAMSGVLFTLNPTTGAPYYIINYEENGNTNAVTSGTQSNLQTFIISKTIQAHANKKFNGLINLAQELEDYFNQDNLDIEFAFDQNENLFLLQVRSLVISARDGISIDQNKDVLKQIEQKINSINVKHPYLQGEETIFGIMPDWNPAEIIGIRPRPLALSLYKELITNNIWAYQRDNYGYRNLRSFPLLIDFYGLPYIDVRVSFNSFIPKGVDDPLASKLVNYYLARLREQPALHDKIEFDIVYSCYTFDLPDRLKSLEPQGFAHAEIASLKDNLLRLTNEIINKDSGLWMQDIEKIEVLKKHYSQILHHKDLDEISKIYWLLEDCKRYGTLPFAGLARAGFIAMQMLNSLVSVNLITSEQRFIFLNSLDSISSQMTRDLNLLDRDHFLKQYGHLRPGTYDILSLRYDEDADTYFDWGRAKDILPIDHQAFELSAAQTNALEKLLAQHGIAHYANGLFNFLKTAIEGREYSKFVFTKSLSDVLSLIKSLGQKHGLSPEHISYLDIQTLIDLYGGCHDIKEALQTGIEKGKKKYQFTAQIMLPPLICSATDVWAFRIPDNKPNFITHKAVIASVLKDLNNIDQMKGKIIFIPSADPGFDWIFTHGIAGFVTAYGGVNSHMAIRANELGLPAVIGAGEKLYQKWLSANKLHIDCANHLVELVH